MTHQFHQISPNVGNIIIYATAGYVYIIYVDAIDPPSNTWIYLTSDTMLCSL